MLRRASSIVVLALICLGSRAAAAQDDGAARPRVSWAAWGGLAQNSPANLWGRRGGHDIAVVALRITRPFARTERFTWDYVLDVVPGAWVSMPRAGTPPPSGCEKLEPGEPCQNYRAFAGADAVHGFGIAPLGVQLRFRAASWVQPYAAVSGGVLRFARPVPVDFGARLNFTADAGGGVLLGAPGRLGLVLGYKFYHISNAGTAPRNPGLDGHMVVVGFQRTAR